MNGETNKNAVPAEGGYLRDFHGEPQLNGTHLTDSFLNGRNDCCLEHPIVRIKQYMCSKLKMSP